MTDQTQTSEMQTPPKDQPGKKPGIIRVEGMHKWYGDFHVLKDLNLTVDQGERIVICGPSGSGKSTLARIVYAKFIESGGRSVTLLDGDVVRHNLSGELGFSKKDRDINVKRIGYVASEITKNRGVAICAPIAPYTKMRREVRASIEQHGAFIEIHVSTSLEECERRDRKGLYAKARKGLIPEFTGISDPYDIPETSELTIDTENMSPIEASEDIFLYLIREGYVSSNLKV